MDVENAFYYGWKFFIKEFTKQKVLDFGKRKYPLSCPGWFPSFMIRYSSPSNIWKTYRIVGFFVGLPTWFGMVSSMTSNALRNFRCAKEYISRLKPIIITKLTILLGAFKNVADAKNNGSLVRQLPPTPIELCNIFTLPSISFPDMIILFGCIWDWIQTKQQIPIRWWYEVFELLSTSYLSFSS